MSVATPVSRGRKPIQLRADALRHVDMPFGAVRGFPLMADETAKPGSGASEKGWAEADLKRAIVVAEEAGLRAYRVEIAPDGTIRIIVEDQATSSGSQ